MDEGIGHSRLSRVHAGVAGRSTGASRPARQSPPWVPADATGVPSHHPREFDRVAEIEGDQIRDGFVVFHDQDGAISARAA